MEPDCGLRLRLDHAWSRSPGPQKTIAPRHLLKMMPLAARFAVSATNRDESSPVVVHLSPIYTWYTWKTKRRNRKPIMDMLNMQECKQIYGCPLGGIGTGSIGRGFKGEFCRFQLVPGMYDYTVVPEDQFLINIQDSKNNTIYQSVLSAYTKPKSAPASWEWNLNGKDCEYTALYPQAWTTYDLSKYGIKLVCKQISPVIPHNYKDSSLPCAVFLWDVINVSSEKRHVSITFTFRDVPDTTKRRRENKVNFERYCDNYTCGVTMEQKVSEMSCTFTIAKKKQPQDSTIDGFCKFNTKKTANSLWESLKAHGRVMPNDIHSDKHIPNAMGLSSQITLEAGCTDRLEFCLVWDMPVVHFGNKSRTYNRYYTKFFGNEGIAGPNIATYGLMSYKKWEQDITDWQLPIVDDDNLPDWLKSALMNELYYIADGGTVWFDVSDQYPVDDPRWLYGMFAYLEGHEYRMYNTYDVHFYASFALAQLWPNLQVSLQYQFKETTLKSITTNRKYLWSGTVTERKLIDSVPHDLGDPDEEPFILHNAYNIHDVSEWRDLNTKFILQVFRDITFLKAIKQQQDNLDRYQSLEYIDEDVDEDEDLYSRSTNQNTDRVFDNLNKTNVQTKNKPLNGLCKYPDNENKPRPRVKYVSISSEYNFDDDMTYVKHGSILRQNSNPFVLSSQVSHYGELMADYDTEVYDSERYLNDMYPVCRKLIDKMLSWDKDKDGLIENTGSADQTFDVWAMTGASSYCGGLWLASLQCMQTMAALLGIQDDIKLFKSLLDKGKASFEKKLWNGKYYDFDETQKVIMADQLCGQWYLRACGYQYSVFPKENVKSALKTIYDNNVLKFGGGLMGAVNGYIPAVGNRPGHVDQSCIQSKESWTGVTYGLSALMIYEGMMDEAMKTAGGLYNTLSGELGMNFETPEAVYENGKYRSQGYMRPLSIWGMHHAYNASLKNSVKR